MSVAAGVECELRCNVEGGVLSCRSGEWVENLGASLKVVSLAAEV